MKEATGGRFRIMGNINTTDLLRAQPDEIERQVIKNLEAEVDIISPGCAISPECPNRNLKALAETAARYGTG
jgi:[methyl-Co(III) methanol-specific corrinoid protein]:coenzyme M methyltransferase